MSNPYPTKTRLRLAERIAAGDIRHHHFVTPETRDLATDGLVTSKVAELVAAKLAEYGTPEYEGGHTTVRLTDAGRAWLAVGVVPVSSSPETGPDDRCCPAYPNCHEPVPGPLVAESTKDGG